MLRSRKWKDDSIWRVSGLSPPDPTRWMMLTLNPVSTKVFIYMRKSVCRTGFWFDSHSVTTNAYLIRLNTTNHFTLEIQARPSPVHSSSCFPCLKIKPDRIQWSSVVYVDYTRHLGVNTLVAWGLTWEEKSGAWVYYKSPWLFLGPTSSSFQESNSLFAYRWTNHIWAAARQIDREHRKPQWMTQDSLLRL